MEKQEVIEKINQFLIEEFEVDGAKIQPDAVMREVLQLDSLDYVDLVVIIESNFGFKVKGEDFYNISTFTDFYDYIIEKTESNILKTQ